MLAVATLELFQGGLPAQGRSAFGVKTVAQTENLQLAGSARWKSMGIGALIALGGLIAGILWPRGGARGGRKIKL